MLDLPNHGLIAGVDEAGRGCLAGPVVAACVSFLPRPGRAQETQQLRQRVRDSKRLTARAREALYHDIRTSVATVSLGMRTAHDIDQTGILNATFEAMTLAVLGLGVEPALVAVDGPFAPPLPFPSAPVVRGDDRIAEVAAASIVAKVVRDRCMQRWAFRYPQFNLKRHKGYPTPEHKRELQAFAPAPIHRTTFRGVLPSS